MATTYVWCIKVDVRLVRELKSTWGVGWKFSGALIAVTGFLGSVGSWSPQCFTAGLMTVIMIKIGLRILSPQTSMDGSKLTAILHWHSCCACGVLGILGVCRGMNWRHQSFRSTARHSWSHSNRYLHHVRNGKVMLSILHGVCLARDPDKLGWSRHLKTEQMILILGYQIVKTTWCRRSINGIVMSLQTARANNRAWRLISWTWSWEGICVLEWALCVYPICLRLRPETLMARRVLTQVPASFRLVATHSIGNKRTQILTLYACLGFTCHPFLRWTNLKGIAAPTQSSRYRKWTARMFNGVHPFDHQYLCVWEQNKLLLTHEVISVH